MPLRSRECQAVRDASVRGVRARGSSLSIKGVAPRDATRGFDECLLRDEAETDARAERPPRATGLAAGDGATHRFSPALSILARARAICSIHRGTAGNDKVSAPPPGWCGQSTARERPLRRMAHATRTVEPAKLSRIERWTPNVLSTHRGNVLRCLQAAIGRSSRACPSAVVIASPQGHGSSDRVWRRPRTQI
jgi:hypothetical protein